MSYVLGRQQVAGMGKESAYGTAVTPAAWIPFQEFTISDQKVILTDNSGIGTREDTLAVDTDHTLSQGNLNGVVYVDEFRHILNAAIGAPTRAAVAGATGAFTDTFEVGKANTLPSYTIAAKDSNEDVAFTGAMLNELTINAATGNYATFTSTWLGRESEVDTNTAAITDGQVRFRPEDISIKYANDVASLSGASAKSFQQFALSFSNNIQTLSVLGTKDPEFVPGILSASLTLNKPYKDTEFKNLVFGIDKKAVQITLKRSDLSIGTGTPTNPSITITFEPGYFAEWNKEGGLDDIRTEAITFQPARNFSNSKNVVIAVVSTGAAV